MAAFVMVLSPASSRAQNWDAFESAFEGLSDYFADLADFEEDDLRVRVGAAVGRVPDYSGASKYETRLLPLFQIRYKDQVWVDPLGLRLKVWDSECCRLLAQGSLAPGRNPRPDMRVAQLPDISSGLDLGFTFEGRLAEVVAFRIRGRKEVAGGHGGVGLSASIATAIPVGPVRVVPELALEWKNETYMDKFYGVPASAVSTTGYDFYDPGAGFEDAVMRVTVQYNASENWQLLARVQGGFLLKEAKNAPFVQQEGNDFQGLFGVGALYTF